MKIKMISLVCLTAVLGFSCGSGQKGDNASSGRLTFSSGSAAVERIPKDDPQFRVVMARLLTSSQSWTQLDVRYRENAVLQVKKLFQKRENTAILKDPGFYAARVSELIRANPDLSRAPIQNVMKIAAVMAYDFYNGEDKEKLARETLGESLYRANKTRQEALQKRNPTL